MRPRWWSGGSDDGSEARHGLGRHLARPASAPATALALAVVAVALGGCSPEGRSSGTGPTRHTVVVLAASSLTGPLTAMARDFEASHPGTDIRVSFAASSTVVAQVNQGAPADLLALAGRAAAAPLDKSRIVGGAPSLASNTLEIATPPGNPGNVEAITDLSRPTLKVVLCAATVPCGKAAAKALSFAGVVAHVVSYEIDVKATLAKVQLGEADAAIVYRSDVLSAGGRVHGVLLPASVNQTLDYPLIRLTQDPTAAEFASYVLSDQGRKRLRDNGFLTP
ncbi:MAG: molybdate ABC transporter substrate-binding protein [Actinomycetota bacterium]